MANGTVPYPSLSLPSTTVIHNDATLQQRVGNWRVRNALSTNAPGAFILHIDEEEDEGIVWIESGERRIGIGQVCEETGNESLLQTTTIQFDS